MVDPSSTFGGYGEVVTVAKAVAALHAAGGRRFALVVRPGWSESLSDVFAAAYEAGRLLLVVDEVAEFGGRLQMDNNFLRVVQKGRNRYVDVLTTCQTPTDLDARIRAQYSAAITFRLAAPLHAERWAAEFARRPEIAPHLLELPRFTFVRADFGGGISAGTIPDPAVHGAP
jgi:hypothetical protein